MSDTITLPRQTVQQALDALERTNSEPGSMAYEREAKASVALEDALRAAPQQQAEPVAWIAEVELSVFARTPKEKTTVEIWKKPVLDSDVAIYTAPPQRKPLTDEMRKQMKEASDSMVMRGAFANGWLSAEAAHGIKEGT